MKKIVIKKIIVTAVAILSLSVFYMASAQMLLPTININPSDITQTSPTTTDITGTTVNFTASTQVKIEYWEGPAVAVYNHVFGGQFTAAVNSSFIQTLTNLSPNTTYTFQIVDSVNPTIIYTPSPITFTTQANTVGVIITNPTTTCSGSADGYCLLAPIGGLIEIKDSKLNDYFGLIYRILIGLAGALAVIMIFFGGVQYMTSDALGERDEAKKRIWNAVIGLIIALGSYAILNTINPNLLDFTFGIDKESVNFTPDNHTPQALENGKYCIDQNAKQGYSPNDPWDVPADEAAKRASLTGIQVTIQNPSTCTSAGQATCTSVSGLNLAGVTAVRSKCATCQLILNGGTECWLHSKGTKHGKGSAIVDFDDTVSLQDYIQQDTSPTIKKNWGTMYTVDGITFVDEGDHIHLVSY